MSDKKKEDKKDKKDKEDKFNESDNSIPNEEILQKLKYEKLPELFKGVPSSQYHPPV